MPTFGVQGASIKIRPGSARSSRSASSRPQSAHGRLDETAEMRGTATININTPRINVQRPASALSSIPVQNSSSGHADSRSSQSYHMYRQEKRKKDLVTTQSKITLCIIPTARLIPRWLIAVNTALPAHDRSFSHIDRTTTLKCSQRSLYD